MIYGALHAAERGPDQLGPVRRRRCPIVGTSARNLGPLQGQQVFLLSTPHRVQGSRCVERHEPSSMPHRKREQVQIRDLARSMDTRRIDELRVQQADVIGPEFMQRVRAGFR